jgi:hypothetical protein
MQKRNGYFLIGIGIASILTGIYAALRSGEIFDSLSAIFLIPTISYRDMDYPTGYEKIDQEIIKISNLKVRE